MNKNFKFKTGRMDRNFRQCMKGLLASALLLSPVVVNAQTMLSIDKNTEGALWYGDLTCGAQYKFSGLTGDELIMNSDFWEYKGNDTYEFKSITDNYHLYIYKKGATKFYKAGYYIDVQPWDTSSDARMWYHPNTNDGSIQLTGGKNDTFGFPHYTDGNWTDWISAKASMAQPEDHLYNITLTWGKEWNADNCFKFHFRNILKTDDPEYKGNELIVRDEFRGGSFNINRDVNGNNDDYDTYLLQVVMDDNDFLTLSTGDPNHVSEKTVAERHAYGNGNVTFLNVKDEYANNNTVFAGGSVTPPSGYPFKFTIDLRESNGGLKIVSANSTDIVYNTLKVEPVYTMNASDAVWVDDKVSATVHLDSYEAEGIVKGSTGKITLSDALRFQCGIKYGDQTKTQYENLKIEGTLTVSDQNFLHELILGTNEKVKGSHVNKLDLSKAKFADNTIIASLAQDATWLTELKLPTEAASGNDAYSVTIGANAFAGCTGLTSLTITDAIGAISSKAFADDTNLTEVNVSYGTAPACEADAFENVEANKVEVKFSGDAETNYVDYRAKAGFLYLLTKTGKQNEAYSCVHQAHADFKLTRTFKEKWNTLALPFAVNQTQLKGAFGEGVLVATLKSATHANNDNHFIFYTQTSLKAGEPCIIWLDGSESAIVTKGEYTISNVETPSSAEMKEALKGSPNFYGSDYWNWTKIGSPYNVEMRSDPMYATINDLLGNLKDNSKFVLYIKDNMFYIRSTTDYTTGLRGYRAYFVMDRNQHESLLANGDTPAKPFFISLDDDVTNTIEGISVESGEEKVGDIYTLSGQKVSRGSTNGLAKGIYVVNGKKVIIK